MTQPHSLTDVSEIPVGYRHPIRPGNNTFRYPTQTLHFFFFFFLLRWYLNGENALTKQVSASE